ncbi:hypothetical protein B0T24DRAFT_500092, partial [Lasiosphaeria ovina]
NNLDKGLKYIQRIYEDVAGRFLRDGDFAKLVDNITRRIVEIQILAINKIDQIRQDEPEALETAQDE